ncbi:hypothetical protein M427DRAFT_133451 [Gonapodya prolifera JEL478]|uniref:SH3 domain-containing protein n=1 Tax=Gonapodya prolifera (strain JEL478) TaxID=1344416 RepID=A0A139AKG4_GONPJ|nr:hypothetical protein M427DRAFT_133451 [Gonapodya prolifera JEL478]|eukprot:KXS17291.1 hypothetical protein M427DRAFT_133451 [Gonapodya prolifera JEL478]
MADKILELTARAAAAEAKVVAEMEKAKEAERKGSDLQHTLTALQSLHTTLTHETTSLRSRSTQLDADISTLRQDNTNLRSDMTAARAELASLRSDMATLRGENTTLRNHNAQLLGEINSLRSLAPGSPTGTGGAGQQPPLPRPPTSVRRMMFAIGDYEPREVDEIGFGRGDEIFVNLAFADGWGSGFHTTTQASGHFPLSHVSPDPPTAVFALDRTAPNTTSRMDSLPQFSNVARAKGAPTQDVVGPPGRPAVGAGGANGAGMQGQQQMQQVPPAVAPAADQWRPQPHPLQTGTGVVPGVNGVQGVQGHNPAPVHPAGAGADHRWRTAAQGMPGVGVQGQQVVGRRDDDATARVGDVGGGRV